MTLFALGLSYKAELLLAFEFAVFSGRFNLFVSSGDDHFITSSQARDGGVVPSSGGGVWPPVGTGMTRPDARPVPKRIAIDPLWFGCRPLYSSPFWG